MHVTSSCRRNPTWHRVRGGGGINCIPPYGAHANIGSLPTVLQVAVNPMIFLQRTARVFIVAWLLIALPVLAANKPEDSRGLKPITLSIPGETQPVALYGESHALVIGASDYNNGWPKLPGVKSDVEAVAQVLEKHGFDVIKVVNPTGEKLDRAIKHFVSLHGQKKDSRLLIYFAGHGYTLKPDAERQLGYLVPVDAPLSERDSSGFIESALSMEAMEGYAKQIRSKHALFVFDACFSGAFFKMRTAPEAIALKTTQPVRQFITSGGADQPVPDISIFRKEFVAALEGAADLNHDGYVTGSELGSYLEDKVTNYSHQTQTPQYGKIQDRNLDKGDFVFALDTPPRLVTPVVQPMPQGPDAPKLGSLALDDIQAEGKRRADWSAWQERMRADYAKVAAMTDSPDLKTQAWERFLAAYPQANPYNSEADTLRAHARQWSEEAKRQVQGLADGAERAQPAHKLKRAHKGARASFEPEMVAIPGKDFEMGKYEVTQAQWRAVMGSNPSFFKDCGDNCPVETVTWDNVQQYLTKLNLMSGKQYRSPTESEWKYACDGGENHSYCGGDDLDGLGWFGDNSGEKTHPVGQKRPNGYGLYDMSGNVWEWMQDCVDDKCSERVPRGGSWNNSLGITRDASGHWYSAARVVAYVGFRVVRSPRTN